MSPLRETGRAWTSRLLMVASGFASLGYQVIWTQQCALWLGHEAPAILAVLAAFFAGLGFGALLFGSRIEQSARPARWYAGCELVVALWSLVVLGAWAPFSAGVLQATGLGPSAGWQWCVAFGGTFLMFLPATAAMGATLPAMERLGPELASNGRSIAGLYASNTSGAVLGVLTTAFWLIPGVGLARSAALCVALNLLCGSIALCIFPKTVQIPGARRAEQRRALRALTPLAISGFLGIGYEVLIVRVLSQVTEETVYTFALLLAVYLVGSALGAAAYQRLGLTHRGPALRDHLLLALAITCLLGTACLWAAEGVRAAVQAALGEGVAPALAAEGSLALLAFGLPTFVMGALFSHLSWSANAAGVSFGRALGVNTLGAAAAPVAFGVLALPALGSKVSLLSIVVGYLGVSSRRAWRTKAVWATAVVAAALALFGPPLTFVEVPSGGHVVSYREGVAAAVSVVEDGDGVRRLRIDNRQQEGSSATRRVDARQAWLPLLLHRAPHRALFLGLGTGVTASSAADDPTLDVDAVELLPEVVAASSYFMRERGAGGPGSRLHVITADARRYVRASSARYDVIVSDNFHPARSGSGALYTVEHFEAVRRALVAGGLFCQWLPLHQLDLETLRSIVRSFVDVYPQAWALIASNSLETPVLGLIGGDEPGRFEVSTLRDRLASSTPTEALTGLGLEDEYAVLGSFVAGPPALSTFAGLAAANTDDHPVVAYRAPRVTYAPDISPRDRLLELLPELSIEPQQLILPPSDSTWPARLAAYWTARDRFIAYGRDVRPSARVEGMLAQVREPLLSVLRISPDFRPAYDPLLAMASALARSDADQSRALLAELNRIQPARPEASQTLARLSDGSPGLGRAVSVTHE